MPSVPSQPPSGLRHRRGGDALRPIAGTLALPPGHLATIDDSHARCQAMGLSRIERPDYAPLGRSDLNLVRERNHQLFAHAAPVMDMLFEQIIHSESMVVLCDATGTIIHAVGDDDFLSRASKVALQPGVNWSEQSKGTNAIGTALMDETATLVHADEHFMHANHFLTCSATPILDPRGNIAGVLDVTGDHRSYHSHTMALVKMSARMIENHILNDGFRDHLRLHLHPRGDFIGTLVEGILAIGQDGRVAGANRSALDLLRMSGATVRKHTLASLFGTTVNALMDAFRVPGSAPVALATPSGLQFQAVARFRWPGTQVAMGHAARHAAEPTTAHRAPARDAATAEAPMAEAPKAESQKAESPKAGEAHEALDLLNTGDPLMGVVIAKVRRVMDRDIPLLLLGDTGTGKETLARAVHAASQRNGGPFVSVNFQSLPPERLDAELFGDSQAPARAGRLLQAAGGTLFLDEIGEMPAPAQSRLLRALQERQLTPNGGLDPVPLDVAVISATRCNLRELMGQQRFREDLYYQLNGLAIRLPTLRERADLSTLARQLVQDLSGDARMAIEPAALQVLRAHPWPGNLRQLATVLRTACALAADEGCVRLHHLPDDVIEEAQTAEADTKAQTDIEERHTRIERAYPPQATPATPPPDRPPSRPSLEEQNLETIRHAVAEADGNISVAAKRLGISRNTIYRKLRWNPPK